MRSSVSDIKRQQKEAQLLREISRLFMEASLDNPELGQLMISKISLSSDKSLCTVLFYSNQGKEHFDSLLPQMKLFKPSLRKALAERIQSRRTPEIRFKFDEQFEKQQQLEQLLDSVKKED